MYVLTKVFVKEKVSIQVMVGEISKLQRAIEIIKNGPTVHEIIKSSPNYLKYKHIITYTVCEYKINLISEVN